MHVRAVIFDWAGTLVDFGSLAPVVSLRQVFCDAGVRISDEEVRRGMGLGKLDHIKAIAAGARVGDAWAKQAGAPFGDADAERLHENFQTISKRVASERGRLIPGVLSTTRALRANGILIGSTTGYSRAIMESLVAVASAQGFDADCVVCDGDVPEGRPSPLAIYACLVQLGVYPPAAAVKVDDTVAGLIEGKSAGCWTVGISETGNEMGLDEESLLRMPEPERSERANAAAKRLTDAGADYVIGSAAELLPVIDDINERLAEGERPSIFEL